MLGNEIVTLLGNVLEAIFQNVTLNVTLCKGNELVNANWFVTTIILSKYVQLLPFISIKSYSTIVCDLFCDICARINKKICYCNIKWTVSANHASINNRNNDCMTASIWVMFWLLVMAKELCISVDFNETTRTIKWNQVMLGNESQCDLDG